MPTVHPMASELVYRVALLGPPGAGKMTALSRFAALAEPRGKAQHATQEASLTAAASLRLVTPGLPPTSDGMARRLVIATLAHDPMAEADQLPALLDGLDGFVFVADSRRERQTANAETMARVVESLRGRGIEVADLPGAVLLNHRDRGDIGPVDEVLAAVGGGRAWFLGASDRRPA